MSSPSGADDAILAERELAQLDALVDEPVDELVPTDVVAPEASDAADLEVRRRLAARFLSEVDRPLWVFNPERLSVSSEPTTFLDLIAAREKALLGGSTQRSA